MKPQSNLQLDVPYPKIIRSENNPFYVSLLQNLYADNKGELSAILQYTYQTSIFSKSSKEIAKTIMGIAIVEMDHMAELANAIICFGGDPQYRNSKGIFYNTKEICYCNDQTGMLLSDLQNEKYAIKAYGDTASMVPDQTLKALLLHIQAEEEMHQHAIEKLLFC